MRLSRFRWPSWLQWCLGFVLLGIVLIVGLPAAMGNLVYQTYRARLETPPLVENPRTFYISSRGNDANTGRTVQEAWRTLARANRFNFTPGDQLLLEGGTRFSGYLTFDKDDVGTLLNPITIGSYGAEPAVIDAGQSSAITLTNTMAFRVTNLHLVGSGLHQNNGSGVAVSNDLPGNIKLPSIRLDHLEAEGFGDYGIHVDGNRGKSGFRNVLIDHASTHNNGLGGIVISGNPNPFSRSYAHEDIQISFSKAYENYGVRGKRQPHSGSGIILSDVRRGIIDHAEAYSNGQYSESKQGGPVGIWAWDSDSVIIEYSHSHHNHTSGPMDGGGFDLDGWVTNSLVQYNYSHDNDGAGYLLCQFPVAVPHPRRFNNNTVRYNLSVDDGRRNSYGSIFVFGPTSGVHIYNNTVATSPALNGQPRSLHIQHDSVRQGSIRNNIFIASGGLPLVDIEHGQVGLNLQGNDYFSPNRNILIRWDGVSFNNLQSWRNATDQERIGGHDVGISIDPGFVGKIHTGEHALAFQLRPDSPLRDAGLNLPALFRINTGLMDFFGSPIPSDAGFEIGAAEVVLPAQSSRPVDVPINRDDPVLFRKSP